MTHNLIQKFSEELRNRFPDQVRLNERLRGHTSYGVGGPATAFCQPATQEELQNIIKDCHAEKIPYFILGSGSNVLVHDSGLNVIVINLEKCCAGLYHENRELYAGAGVLVSDLVKYCEENNLAGLDFMSGIPGTVGGALRMNAGAFTGEIGDRVYWIDAMTQEGRFLKIMGKEAGFSYRTASALQDKIILGCQLELLEGSQEFLKKSREDYLKQRASKQPLDYGSCGSVFKRPPGNYAGTLIEQAGCKGMRIGGAMVSYKHANFIINDKEASAENIYQLIVKVQKEVYKKFGIRLELEVKLIGFSPEEAEKVKVPHE